MTVKELIKILEEQKPDAQVMILSVSEFNRAWVTIEEVISSGNEVMLYEPF